MEEQNSFNRIGIESIVFIVLFYIEAGQHHTDFARLFLIRFGKLNLRNIISSLPIELHPPTSQWFRHNLFLYLETIWLQILLFKSTGLNVVLNLLMYNTVVVHFIKWMLNNLRIVCMSRYNNIRFDNGRVSVYR